MEPNRTTVIIFLFFSAVTFLFADTTTSCPDSHAPIGIIGDHAHKSGEMMLAYRFMAMNMQGLQSGNTVVKTVDVLKDFMVVPTQMGMQMHMLGAMFALHNKVTLMGMVNYQQRHMEMEGAHYHQEGRHEHPVGTHEMSSTGIGDVKLDSLLTLWKTEHLALIGNIGVSLPTGSIAQQNTDRHTLPYPMQLGSGSFEGRQGITLFAHRGNWSYGTQLRATFPLHTNANEYRQGNSVDATTWGARRISNWFSLSGRLLFSHTRNISGSHPNLNQKMSPSHRPDFRGSTRLDLSISSNLLIPEGTFAGQRLAVEFHLPIVQHLEGIQLKNRWRLMLGWQYAFFSANSH